MMAGRRRRVAGGLRPFWRAVRLWTWEGCSDLSAAFAYHTLQSLLPILLIALSVLAWFLGRDDLLLSEIRRFSLQFLPENSWLIIEKALTGFIRQRAGAGAFGVVTLVLTASNAFLALHRGADRLWWGRQDLEPQRSWLGHLRHQVQLRLKAMLALAIVLALLMVDQRIALSGVRIPVELFQSLGLSPPRLTLWEQTFTLSAGVTMLASFSLLLIGSLLLLWLLPSRRVPWRRLLPGALTIAVLMTLLKQVLSRLLLALGGHFQAYGVVGGVLVFSLSVWLVGAIVYYGQCLSIVLGRRQTGV